MDHIENAWYRISVKALIYDTEKNILLIQEENGNWDFPGGGLDHGEDPLDGLQRELQEEMGCKIRTISPLPCDFITAHKPKSKTRPWIANIFYEVTLENFKFKKSQECTNIGFFNTKSVQNISALPNVQSYFEKISTKKASN